MSTRTILIVDDESDLRDLIAASLEVRGYLCLQADGGRSAFEIVSEQNVDLVLSDVRMPDGDGVSLLKRLMAMKHPPHVLMMSGYSDISEPELFKLGAKGFLHKPFNSKELASLIENLLGPKVVGTDSALKIEP